MPGPAAPLPGMRRLWRRVERRMMGRRAYKWVLRDWLSLHDIPAAAAALGTLRFTRQIEPQLLEGPAARDILVVAPHPDDEIIGPGGTLIRAARGGARVTVLYVTPGRANEAEERMREAEACCRAMGAQARFAGEMPGGVRLAETARAIADALVATGAKALFIPFLLDDHDDHRRVNEALPDALASSGASPEIWAYQVYAPLPGNVVVDIAGEAGAKAAAIRLYESQMRQRDWAHFALGLNAFNSRLLPGRNIGPCHAESFFVLPAPDYSALCRTYFTSGQAYYLPGYAAQ